MTDQNPPSPEPAEPAQWPSAYPAAPASPPPAYPSAGQVADYQPATRTSSNAIVALVLSVASWAVCPIVAAIVALVFASMASKEIDSSGGRIEGRGLVTAARIVAWINIGVTIAVIVVTAFVFVLIAIAGGFDGARN